MNESDNCFSQTEGVEGSRPLQSNAAVRRFVSRPTIEASSIVAALLVSNESGGSQELPLVSESDIPKVAKEIWSLGIKSLKVFVKVSAGDKNHRLAIGDTDFAIRILAAIKNAEPRLCVITDTCLCSFTIEGECAIAGKNGAHDAEATFALLGQLAINQRRAGADIIGPAPMMGGAVAAIRKHLKEHGLSKTPIMPHLTMRSALYREYRQEMATGSGEQRQGFQVDPSMRDIYLLAALQMRDEGADLLMLQPSLFTMDLVESVRRATGLLAGVYSVSGEYLMMKRSASSPRHFYELLLEHALASRRSGAHFIVTYAWRELIEGQKNF